MRHQRHCARNLACAGVVAGLVAFGPAPAEATILRCGQTITRSTTLSRGIGPCAGTAVVIGANNITLNLGGHSIRGQQFSTTGPAPAPAAGVAIGAHHGVTVENGNITGYVTWAPFRGIFVTRDAIEAGAPAPPGGGRPSLAIGDHVVAIGTSDRIHVIGDYNLISSLRSGPTEAEVWIQGQHNHITRSGTRRDCSRGLLGPGFAFEFDGSHNLVDDNYACRISLAFFLTAGGQDNTVKNDTVIGGPIVSAGGELGADGRYVTISGERIVGNHVRDKPAFAGEVAGIHLFDTSDSLVSRNDLLYSGISLAQSFSDFEPFGPLYPSIDHNRLMYNSVADVSRVGAGGPGNQGDGIDIPGPAAAGGSTEPGSRHSVVEHNTTNHNSHDGIDNGAPTTTLFANVADYNGNLGINSVAGATDLGLNQATGNANRAQCRHVRCR